MKYLFQVGIICGISFIGEMMHLLLPLPVPASVYGLVLLFLLLMTKVVKMEQIEETADFFMTIMPILFISPSVSLIRSWGIIKDNMLALILMIAISTIAVMVVTGLVSQGLIQIKTKGIEKNPAVNEAGGHGDE